MDPAQPQQRRQGQRPGSLAQLIAPAKGLASPGPRSSVVSTPHNLPSMIPYGTVPPGQAQSSNFTGGVVQNPASLVQNQTQDFTAPSYGPLTQGSQGAYTGGTLSPMHALASLIVSAAVGGSAPPGHTPPLPGYQPVGSFDYASKQRQVLNSPVQSPIGPLHSTYEGSIPQRPPVSAAALATGGKRRVYAV